jgi:hypothetical protein
LFGDFQKFSVRRTLGPQTENPKIAEKDFVRKLQTRKLPNLWVVRQSNKFLSPQISRFTICGTYAYHLLLQLTLADRIRGVCHVFRKKKKRGEMITCTGWVLSFMLSFNVIIFCYHFPPFFFFLKTWHTRIRERWTMDILAVLADGEGV